MPSNVYLNADTSIVIIAPAMVRCMLGDKQAVEAGCTCSEGWEHKTVFKADKNGLEEQGMTQLTERKNLRSG